MDLDEEDRQLAIADFERKHGITEGHRDHPRRYIGYPPSRYYIAEEPDYEESHREATAALTRLDKILASLA